MEGLPVCGSSCLAERTRARGPAGQEGIEMAFGDFLVQVITDEGRSALDAYVREGA